MLRLPKALVLGLVTGVAGLGASFLPVGNALQENLDLEILFHLRGIRTPPAEVLIVSVDKASADFFNLPNDLRKWPRTLHAILTERLATGGASVIAYDIFFEEPRSEGEDRRFAEAVGNAGNVILCERLQGGTVSLTDKEGTPAAGLRIATLVPPIPALSKAAAALTPFPLPKIPFKVNKGYSFRTGAGETPTMPIVAFQIFAMPVYGEFRALLERVRPDRVGRLPRGREDLPGSRGIERIVGEVRSLFKSDPSVGDRLLAEMRISPPLTGEEEKRQRIASLVRMYQSDEGLYLNFYGPPGTIRTVPYFRVLRSPEGSSAAPPIDVRGKAVFVGSSESWQPEQKDGYYTVFSRSDGLDLSGVEIAATAFANLLEDLPVRPLDFRASLLLVFLWGLAIGSLCLLFSPAVAVPAVAGLCLLYLAVAAQRFAADGAWYPVVLPLFLQPALALGGAVLWSYVDSNRERRTIRRAFEHYLPNEVVDQLANNLAGIKARGELVYGICLATDAEHYTSLSESMDPKELGPFMNRYYETVFDPVRRHGGAVSNVIGDSMLAIWVAARPDPALRDKSCLAALDIARAMRGFNPSHGARQLPTRIGLHAGNILLGNIGAGDHYEYRPVGDIVNTATRIEGLNKPLGTRILASKEVVLHLSGFLTREVGKFLMAGKSKPVVVHELICRLEESDEFQRSACGRFAEALDAFRRQRWDEAEEKFHDVSESLGDDGPSRFHMDLCARYRKHPPAEPWDGAVRMEKN
ncbi:MAG TPA: adenylate/guanylate cyclase domain-containing protein [Candidatus Limnocylindrales bacterium]|nr:adenylate/guanylate cyclase domain-containing protein [Candidatus Limnocylindrales bacterium]